MNPKGPVMLQEFIGGIEMGVSRWMGRDGWISPPNINFEHKKLMSSNYGPNTGEMGTVMAYVKKEKLDDEMMSPIEKGLMQLGHLGDCDVNCIIDEKGKAWPLEFTNRPGYPAFYLMLNQHKGDPAQWMADAIHGKMSLEVSYDVGVTVLIAQPDCPYCKRPHEETEGNPIYGINKSNLKSIQPMDVKIEKRPDMVGDKVVERAMWVTGGQYIAVANALGPNVSVAAKRAYEVVKGIHVSDMMVRDDIGKGLEDQLPKLQKLGYATGIRYE